MPEYLVQRSDNGVDGWTDILSGISVEEADLTGQGVNVTKYYRIIESELDYEIARSDVEKIVLLSSPELTAVGGANEDRIRLTWTDVSASGYNLYRYDNRTYSWLRIFSGSELEFSDVAVRLDETYWYFVAPISSDSEEGTWSNFVSATLTKTGVIMANTRSTQHQGIQFGWESTAGTLVPATTRLINLEVNATPDRQTSSARFQGTKGVTGIQSGKQAVEASFSGILDFSMINYLMEMGWGTVTPTTSNNGTTRIYNPSSLEVASPRTGTFEIGSLAGAEKFGYAYLKSLGIKWGSNSLSIDGSIAGSKIVKPATPTTCQKLTVVSTAAIAATSLSVTVAKLDGSVATGTVAAGTYVVDLPFVNPLGTTAYVTFTVTSPATITAGAATLTVSSLAAQITAGSIAYTIREVLSTPADPQDVGVYLSTDGSSWTLLEDVMEGEISVDDVRKHKYFNNPNDDTFNKLVEGANTITASLTVEDDTEASQLVGYLDAGTKIFLRLSVLGSTINASPLVRHTFTLDIPMFVVKDDPGDKDGAYGTTLSLEGAHDAAFGLFKCTTVSRIAVL